jgi:iron complex outermembrane receptor protein
MQLKYIFFYCNFILTCSLFSQADFQEIRLIDMDDALPIIGASFHYGSQQGVSDKDGLLRFNYVPGQSMEVSHINYGPWTWDDEKILHLIQDKISYRRSISVNLYPVTVIAVRPTSKPDDKVTIDYQERMEHDAAAILNQIPAFNSIRKGGNYGFDPVFRGFKYDQLNVVMDGAQSATAACPNRMDPPTSQMAPNMMDRIEVLKGPHALRYGAGFGATINFVPFKLKFTSQPDIYGRVSTGYAQNGNVVRGETQLGFSSSQIDWSIFGSWSQGDDYQSGNGEEVAAEFSRGSFGTNLGLKLSPKQQLRISALYNRARDAEFPALPMDLRKDDTWLFNVKHNIQFTGEMLQSLNTTFFGSIVDHRMDNLLKSLNPRMLNARLWQRRIIWGEGQKAFGILGKVNFSEEQTYG